MATTTKTMTLGEFASSLERLADVFAQHSYREAWPAVLDIVHEGIAINFLGGVNPDGQPWPPRKHYYPWPILIKTGELLASATEREHGDHIEDLGDNFAVTGSSRFYGPFHNAGTSRLPVREFEGISEDVEDAVIDAILDFVEEEITL